VHRSLPSFLGGPSPLGMSVLLRHADPCRRRESISTVSTSHVRRHDSAVRSTEIGNQYLVRLTCEIFHKKVSFDRSALLSPSFRRCPVDGKATDFGPTRTVVSKLPRTVPLVRGSFIWWSSQQPTPDGRQREVGLVPFRFSTDRSSCVAAALGIGSFAQTVRDRSRSRRSNPRCIGSSV